MNLQIYRIVIRKAVSPDGVTQRLSKVEVRRQDHTVTADTATGDKPVIKQIVAVGDVVALSLCEEKPDKQLGSRKYHGFALVRKENLVDVFYRYQPSDEDLNPCDDAALTRATSLQAARRDNFPAQVFFSVPSKNPRIVELLCRSARPNPHKDCMLSVLTPPVSEKALAADHVGTTAVDQVPTRGSTLLLSNLQGKQYLMLPAGGTLYLRAVRKEAFYLYAVEACWPRWV